MCEALKKSQLIQLSFCQHCSAPASFDSSDMAACTLTLEINDFLPSTRAFPDAFLSLLHYLRVNTTRVSWKPGCVRNYFICFYLCITALLCAVLINFTILPSGVQQLCKLYKF